MSNDKAQDNEKQGMEFLQSLPRRWVTIYIPLAIFVFVLLFPFYWMVITSFKPDAELGMHTSNPFWVVAPTLVHFKNRIFDTAFPECKLKSLIFSVPATLSSFFACLFSAFAFVVLSFYRAKPVVLFH